MKKNILLNLINGLASGWIAYGFTLFLAIQNSSMSLLGATALKTSSIENAVAAFVYAFVFGFCFNYVVSFYHKTVQSMREKKVEAEVRS